MNSLYFPIHLKPFANKLLEKRESESPEITSTRTRVQELFKLCEAMDKPSAPLRCDDLLDSKDLDDAEYGERLKKVLLKRLRTVNVSKFVFGRLGPGGYAKKVEGQDPTNANVRKDLNAALVRSHMYEQLDRLHELIQAEGKKSAASGAAAGPGPATAADAGAGAGAA